MVKSCVPLLHCIVQYISFCCVVRFEFTTSQRCRSRCSLCSESHGTTISLKESCGALEPSVGAPSGASSTMAVMPISDGRNVRTRGSPCASRQVTWRLTSLLKGADQQLYVRFAQKSKKRAVVRPPRGQATNRHTHPLFRRLVGGEP